MFRKLSINRKITLVILLTSSLALVAASAGFIAYDLVTYRSALVRDLGIKAQITAANGSAALQFGDVISATESLAALEAEPSIESASFYDVQGRAVTHYLREGAQAVVPPTEVRDGHVFSRDRLELVRPVRTVGGERVGTLYVRYDLAVFYARLGRYLGIAGLVLLGSLLAAFLISLRLKRVISAPILHLAATARTVSREEDYGIRVTRSGDDELGRLADDFNAMLAEIQRRDAALARHRDHLEEQIAERTTELRIAKEQAEAVSRIKSELLMNMSHEFRTPLTGILGFAQVLEEEVPEPQRGFARAIGTSGRRLMDTLGAVLDLAQLESDGIETRPVDLDVHAVAAEAVAEQQPHAQAKGLALALAAPDDPVTARVDRYCLTTLLHSLLDNAVKFTDAGSVDLELEASATEVTLRVRDTGVGISEAFLPKVFEPFEQESTGAARSYEGSGLGLTVARGMAELLRGTVHAESRPGHGSVFTVTFPRTLAHAPAGRCIGVEITRGGADGRDDAPPASRSGPGARPPISI